MSQPDLSADLRTEVRVDGFDPGLARRVRQTIACHDCDPLPKVPTAGTVFDHEGGRVQVMHNGVLVEEGGYYGAWMAEIIRVLRGHHEPQEELVFAAMVERIAASATGEGTRPTMIEFGCFWAYYSLWFCHEIPGAQAIGIEPDPAYLAVGRRNAELNKLGDRVLLAPGAVGAEPGMPLSFVAESDGVERPVVQYDLSSLMREHTLDRVDLVLVDIQGWERLLVERAVPLLREGRVRFLLVSTHHHSISGDALTHQRVRDLLVEAGATLLAEHTVGESASGDGLIAVSFHEDDADLRIPVTHVRAVDSLFGELEFDLAAAQADASAARARLMDAESELGRAREALATARARTRRLRRRVRTLCVEPTSRTGRLSRRVRTVMSQRLRSWQS